MFGELHHNLWWCKPLCQLPKCQEPFNVSALAPYVELEATSRVQLRAPGTSLSQNLLRTIKGKLTAPWNYFEPKFAIYSQNFFSLFHTPPLSLSKICLHFHLFSEIWSYYLLYLYPYKRMIFINWVRIEGNLTSEEEDN